LDSISHDLHEEDMQALAASCHGFVGADLVALCQEAAMYALRRVVQHRQQAGSKTVLPSQCPAIVDAPAPGELKVKHQPHPCLLCALEESDLP
jgi:SpoVK/Ycf46/Vps4 family AAA+-type ATPase